MTSAVYLEHYLDSLENLPIELQRNFTLMRDLDTRAQEVMRSIDKMADEFINNIKSINSDRKKEIISEIQTHFNKAKEYGDDKVQLAIQTYELVDKHIRRLDSDLQKFDSEIHDKINQAIHEQNNNKRGRKKIREGEKNKRIASSEDESSDKMYKKKKKGGGKAVDKILSSTSVSGVPTEQEILDMPVDPNEPTYCLCHQVSYGEMIGCDNLDCPIEWFHFACVGLTIKPKGKWFCPKCSQDRKKK